MAGHSKWANIKHRKGAQDKKRGKIFTKLIREIQVAAKMGGADINSNPRLRDAIAEAKTQNMPKDTIERAVKRGSGQTDGQEFESVTYEGYGPAGVAILIECLTDNRNRTVAEVRALMARRGGNMGESGSVAWIFEKKGLMTVKKEAIAEEELMDLALEAGAEDIKDEGDLWEVHTPPTEFAKVKDALEAKLTVESAMLTAIPKNSIEVTGEDAEKTLELVDQLEDLDDVQKVYANFDINDADLEKFTA